MFQLCEQRSLVGLHRKLAQPRKCFAIGKQKWVAQLARDAQQFVTMLIANAECDRYWNHAAKYGAPKTLDEMFVVIDENNQLVAGLAALLLDAMQNGQCALFQLGKNSLGFARVRR